MLNIIFFVHLGIVMITESYINNFLKQYKNTLHNYIKINKFSITVTNVNDLQNNYDKHNNSYSLYKIYYMKVSCKRIHE